MRLALFDLDNTLLAGDSDYAWGQYLIKHGLVNAADHGKANDDFYADYLKGTLDIHAYVHFTLQPVMSKTVSELASMQQAFMEEFIDPVILPKALELVEKHKSAGDFTVIITATNTFITKPIAAKFGVDLLLGTDLEILDNRFTGRILGTPCFQRGKVEKLEAWIDKNQASSAQSNLNIEDSVFYTDSINDLPLLERAADPIVVDGDEKLQLEADRRAWKKISLRN